MAQNQSWLELLDSSNSCSNDFLSPKRLSLDFPCYENEDTHQRSFEIEILDKSNEKKFDSLVSQQKLKSPFKRRLSNEKLSEAPTIQVDTPSRQKGKRSKLDIECSNDKRNETLEEGEIISNTPVAKKRLRSESSDASSSNGSNGLFQTRELETDKATLERRQKQIDYGKNTVGYDNYLQQVPKHTRTREHTKTPPKHLKYSRRAWEGLVKAWRKKLHTYDPQDGIDKDNDNATF